MKKLEQTNDILQRLFDPRIKSYNTYVDTSQKKQVRRSMPLAVKKMYYQQYLSQHWEEICGPNLAKQCIVEGLEDNILTIRVASSLFANELFMMKKIFLKKINKALVGSLIIKDLKFHTGRIPKRKDYTIHKANDLEKFNIIKCPLCNANMTSEKNICSVCERQKRKQMHHEIVEILKNQPWLTFKECQKYISCDIFTFNDVKESLQNYYFELVRLGFAEESDCYMAVMLLTGKSIDALNENIIKNSLEFLRRNQDVSTSRI